MRWIINPVFEPGIIALIAIVMLGTTLFIYWQVGDRLSPIRRLTLLGLRIAALLLLLGILLQPSRQEELRRPMREKLLVVALDSSRSMQQADVEQASRLSAAKGCLLDSGLLDRETVRLYQFNSDAEALTLDGLDSLRADGETTQIHESVQTILRSHGIGALRAIVLMTDGRDFGSVPPGHTGMVARQYHTPLYAVAHGGAGRVRDVGVRLGNYQSFTYRRQAFRLDCYVRTTGCQYEDLTVELWRNGERQEQREFNAGVQRETLVSFDCMEDELGRYEYEVRVPLLQQEVDTTNNRALAFVSVIAQEMRILLLEGQPNWDTTFLRRALFANERVLLDAVVHYDQDRTRLLSNYREGDFVLPTSLVDYATYDVIILGRHVDSLLTAEQVELLYRYVNEHGGNLIFARGEAWRATESPADALQPVVWDSDGYGEVELNIGKEGRYLTPFRLPDNPGMSLPSMPASHRAMEQKALSVALAVVVDPESGKENPAIVYRMHGRGSVLSIGVIGLWRWSFNADVSPENNRFQRFWEHLLLWLTVNSDFMPGQDVTFKANHYSLQLGEKIFFQFNDRLAQGIAETHEMVVRDEAGAETRLELRARDTAGAGRLRAEFVPAAIGRYEAAVTLPDGEISTLHFAVAYDNPEEKEVAADPDYLHALCTASGGRMLAADELSGLWAELEQQEVLDRPRIRLTALWDSIWLAYGIVMLLALDWMLRRRWGLC